nr:hypothetical protein [Saccharothrix sp. NRRL B-16314]
MLVSGSSDGGVRRWDAITGVALDGPLHGTGWVWSSAATTADDGRALVVGGFQDGRLERWDAATGRRLAGGARTGWVRAVVTARLNGRTVAFSGSDDGDVRRWDATTGLPVGDPLHGRRSSVWSLAAASVRDGRTVLVGGFADGALWRWDAVTGLPVGDPITAHTGPVRTLAVAGSSLFSASDDGDVRCWDLGTERAGDSLTGHTAPVLSLVPVVLPDGRTLLVGGCRDGAVGRRDRRVAVGRRDRGTSGRTGQL